MHMLSTELSTGIRRSPEFGNEFLVRLIMLLGVASATDGFKVVEGVVPASGNRDLMIHAVGEHATVHTLSALDLKDASSRLFPLRRSVETAESGRVLLASLGLAVDAIHCDSMANNDVATTTSTAGDEATRPLALSLPYRLKS